MQNIMHKIKNSGTKKLTKLPAPVFVRREETVVVLRRALGFEVVAEGVFLAGVFLRCVIVLLIF